MCINNEILKPAIQENKKTGGDNLPFLSWDFYTEHCFT